MKKLLSIILVLSMLLTMLPAVFAAQTGLTQTDTEAAVVVRYDFEDGTANDSSGNGHHGTLVNGAAVTNGMASMTGGKKTASTGIDIPTGAFKGLTDYTMELDVRLSETANWTQLFSMGAAGNYIVLANEGDPNRVLVGLTVAAMLNGGTEQRAKSSGPAVKLPVGELSRMTYTQSGGTAALYINGELVGAASVTTTLGDLAEKNLPASIGRSLMFDDPGMVGAVDEFTLYNYAMTDGQVMASYQDKFDDPILHYDFENVENGVVKDVSGHGYDAVLTGGAAAVEAIDGNALSLTTDSDYLAMPDFLNGLKDMTFSGFVKLDKVEIWTTLFSAGSKSGKYITVNAKGNPGNNPVGYTLAINNGAGEQRVATSTEYTMPAGEWLHFVYAQEGSTAKLYLDGVRVDSLSLADNKFLTHGANMTHTFSDVAGEGSLMLGKSVWPDPDGCGLFDEIKVYDRCLSDREIQALGSEYALKVACDALDLGDLSRVTKNLELPAEGAKGTSISWASSNTQVMDHTGAIAADFAEAEDVILTATITLDGVSMEKRFYLHVYPLTAEEKAQLLLDKVGAYVEAAMDYLINDGYTLPTSDEAAVAYEVVAGDARIVDGKVYKTETSAERQPLTLKAVIAVGDVTKEVVLENITLIDPYVGYILSFFGANSVVDEAHSDVNNKDEKPRLAYSYDGVHWEQLNNNYPVVYPEQGSTKRVRDPFIMRNKDGSFTLMATQGWDTPYIYLWHSENLTAFTNERLLQVTQEGVAGLTGKRAWAPEADYDRITDQYYIYWADPTAGPIYYNTSSDLETVSAPAVYFDPGYEVIDSNIVKDGDTYYMSFKDERSSGKAMKFAKSNSLEPNTWEIYTPNFVTGKNSEGPFVFRDIHDGKWIMYWDFFYGATNERFGYSFSDDLSTGEWDYQGTNPNMPSTDVRHGGVIPVTQKELDAIIDKWGTMSVRVEDNNDVDAAPVAAEVTVNGELRATALPAELSVDEGDVVTIKATLLNSVDYAFASWTVGDTVVGETLDLTYTVSTEEDLVLNLDWIGPDNLAQGKPVTAGQVNDSWAAAHLTDGVLSHLGGNTGWSSKGLGKNTTFTEHAAVIDLGAETQMNAFRLYGRTDSIEGVVNYPVSYTIYTSSDNSSWTPVYTVTGGEVPARYTPAVIQLENAVTARYVKLGVTAVNRGDESGNVYVQLSEMSVYYDRFSDQNLADQVMALIDAVSVEDKASMEAARAAYDALTDRQKALVTNLAKLEEAELYWNTVHTPVSLVLTGADAINAFDESVTYTLSGQDMHNLATMIVSMEITDEYLTDPVVEPAAGWMVVAQAWRDGVLSVAVCNNTGANGDGDILTITLKPNEVAGSASITLTDADLSAYLGDGETLVQVDLDGASITTEVRHNIFDVNKDGVVDQLDMTRAQRYYGTDNTDADVNEDGTVDLDDLILILNNYHEAFE